MFKKIKEFIFGVEELPPCDYDKKDNSTIIIPPYFKPNILVRVKQSITKFGGKYFMHILVLTGVIVAILAWLIPMGKWCNFIP